MKKKNNPYKIIGICQIFNELQKGNLERFVKYFLPLIDSLVVFDDGSTDGSYEFLQNITPHLIRSSKNNFKNEVFHRKKLIEYALEQNPDFILWLDADEVLTSNAKKRLPELCKYCVDNNLDGISMHELNIWRSNTWRRIDSKYDDLWLPRLWKVTESIRYSDDLKTGLHQADLIPRSIVNCEKVTDVAVLHYGFSTERSLAFKFLTYRDHGQSGYDMLNRLIDESSLKLEKLPENLFPKGLWDPNDTRPLPLSFENSLRFVQEFRSEVKKPSISIICLIYKSVDWAKFIYDQVMKFTDLSDVEFFFVANNANSTVLEFLEQNYYPFVEFNSSPSEESEWYINNIYRAYNYGATQAKGDYLVFINSDMAFSPGWLSNLLKSYDGKNCISSRLIESGRLPTGKYGIEIDFGRSIKMFHKSDFLEYAKELSENRLENDGLFMPLFVKKEHFFDVGGYPEGNVTPDSDYFNPKIAKEGERNISGDRVFIEKLKSNNIKHQTAFDSIAYHFQMGEMNSNEEINPSSSDEAIEIVVCNDLLTGSMGERVFWDHLLEFLPHTVGIDSKLVDGKKDYAKKANKYIKKHHPGLSIIIQNATFIGAVDPNCYTIMFLQDNLRAMGVPSEQQELNLKLAHKCVTNSILTASSYPEFDFEIIPIGIDDEIFRPLDKKELRRKLGFGDERIGIFVGAFSDVKGWQDIKKCIEHFPDIIWILVSKYGESYSAPNVKVFNRISQPDLAELLCVADFFILASPVETQCLSALEACLCNTPIIMRNTGIFTSFSDEEKRNIGIFGDDFIDAVRSIDKLSLTPREVLLKKKITISSSMDQWKKIISEAFIEIKSNSEDEQNQTIKVNQPKEFLRWRYPYLAKIVYIFELSLRKALYLKNKVNIIGRLKRLINRIKKVNNRGNQ